MIEMRLIAAVLTSVVSLGAANLTPEQRKQNIASFEYAWKAIGDHMWEPMPAGLDWQKVHDELRPKVEAAETIQQARAVMRDMISRLKMSHFGIVPGEAYDDLPGSHPRGTGGSPGFDLRLIESRAVVHWIQTNSPAYSAGVRNGWEVLRIGDTAVADILSKLQKALPDGTVKELIMTRAVAARFEGSPGEKIEAAFRGRGGSPVTLTFALMPERGVPTRLGHMTTQYVWFETRRIGDAGYIRFNMFMDPTRLATQFGDAVASCTGCKGIIIDLRGNPGGLGGMSMGMAGWFIDRQDVRLGVMKMKGTDLKFAVNPRAEPFRGRLAILVDALSGSTSEIFAGGLKDIGRARIFGTRTAGAALPSVFERLPNGDGLQYAIANYISEGGKPLEGIGVVPDEEVKTTREALLAGRDPALDAAVAWIGKEFDK